MIREALDRLQEQLFGAPPAPEFALLLTGGGARAAYQAGVLRYVADRFPEARFRIVSGVSAGAINAAHLSNHRGGLSGAASRLVESWTSLRPGQVVLPESGFAVARWVLRRALASSEETPLPEAAARRRALMDTSPLRAFLAEQLGAEEGRLTGVAANVAEGRLKAVAIATTNYMTGQTVTWVEGAAIEGWERPNRVGRPAELTVEHIMASTSLPLLFPAVCIDGAWYGDGGIRLTAPLSPLIRLGADRILAISTRYGRSQGEADEPSVVGYPPAAQIIGVLMNAIFLDVLDQDAVTLQQVNALLEKLPRWRRNGLRPVRLLMLRPSVDLARMTADYDAELHGALRLLTTGLGTEESESPDWLSMLLFDGGYLTRLIETGYDDARRQREAIDAFLDPASREEVPAMAGGSLPGFVP